MFHPSAHSEQHEIPPFERMEFLGDAVLGLVVSEELFIKNPNFQEGELSKLKSKLVSRKYLALKAKEIGLGNFITLSKEAENNGGRESVTIVGNAMELSFALFILMAPLKMPENLSKLLFWMISNPLQNWKS